MYKPHPYIFFTLQLEASLIAAAESAPIHAVINAIIAMHKYLSFIH